MKFQLAASAFSLSMISIDASSLRGRQQQQQQQSIEQFERMLQTAAPTTVTLYDPVPASTTSVNSVQPFWTNQQTDTIGGVQTGNGYTYLVNYQNLGPQLLNQLLLDHCYSHNEAGSNTTDPYDGNGDPTDPTNIYDSQWVEAQTSNPSCQRSCLNHPDHFFMDMTNLTANTNLNTLTYGDVAPESTIDYVISTFQNDEGFKVMNETVRQCIFDYEQFDYGSTLYNTSKIAYESTRQFAPGIIENEDDRMCELQLGSAGAYYNGTAVTSLCNPDSPGRQFNKLARNGDFSALYTQCGYEWPTGLPGENDPTTYNPYYDFLLAGPYSCYGIMMVLGCQSDVTSSGGNTDECYCMSDDAYNGLGSGGDHGLDGLRCPLYGPTFYVNLKIVWLLGGADYMKAMPGSRVPCAGTNTCSQTCGADDIENFDKCDGIYYDVKSDAPSSAPSENTDQTNVTTPPPNSSSVSKTTPETPASTSSPSSTPATPASTSSPSSAPSSSPTIAPTTDAPSSAPSASPSMAPTTDAPSSAPSASPTMAPTTDAPSSSPTSIPTVAPTTDAPSSAPSASPSFAPTVAPTPVPTLVASNNST